MRSFFKKLLKQADQAPLSATIKSGAFLVDVRSTAEFSGGSAKGAVNIPLSTISGQLEQFKGKEHIVVFCKSGIRSRQAKKILESKGFKNIINGGSWKNVKACQ